MKKSDFLPRDEKYNSTNKKTLFAIHSFKINPFARG